jgi:hypothetical protein
LTLLGRHLILPILVSDSTSAGLSFTPVVNAIRHGPTTYRKCLANNSESGRRLWRLPSGPRMG